MFVIKERSADSLLKEAKKLIVGSQKKPQSLIPRNASFDVKINENKRNRDVPDYV